MSDLTIMKVSCADQRVDAIVNAANKHLRAGSGICGAIFAKAGHDELQAACDKIKTPLQDGEAVITPSFQMDNCEAVIHAVGPNFSVTPEAFDKLFDAYYNSLLALKEAGYHSIAFPLISSGIFGGMLSDPAGVSAKQALEAYYKFRNDYPDYEIMIKLCCFTDKEFQAASRAASGQ